MDDEDAETGRKSGERSVKSEKCGLTRDTTGGGSGEGLGGGAEGERERECVRECVSERERGTGGEGERAPRSSRSASFGSGGAQGAANCPGFPRWCTAARRRDEPSAAVRKSVPRSRRTPSDSSKPRPQLFFFFFLNRFKTRQRNATPGERRRRVHADSFLCSAAEK